MLNPGLWSFRVGCYCAILAFVPTPLMFWFVVNDGMIDRMTLRFPWNHKNLVAVYLSAASYLVTFHHSSSSRVSPGFVACDNAQVGWTFFTRTHGVRRLLRLGCTTYAHEGTLVPKVHEPDKEAWLIFVNWTTWTAIQGHLLSWSSFHLHVSRIATEQSWWFQCHTLETVENCGRLEDYVYP